jgi:hypothetical protein
MKIDVFTLFPGWFGWFVQQRHVRNAIELGSAVTCVDIRAHTPLGAGQVDDTPYGGGAGMVMRVDVLDAALRGHYGCDPLELRRRRRVIALTPSGRLLDEECVNELAGEEELTLLCGRYEGFDERIVEHFATESLSIGRYVLSGGELPARSPTATPSRACLSTRTTPAPPSTAVGGCRRSCSPATTSASGSGAGGRAKRGQGRALARATRRRAARLAGARGRMARRPKGASIGMLPEVLGGESAAFRYHCGPHAPAARFRSPASARRELSY